MRMEKNHHAGMESNKNHASVIQSYRNIFAGIFLTTQWNQTEKDRAPILTYIDTYLW